MKIKACPFCGHEAHAVKYMHRDGKDRYEECHVECMNILCGARTKPFVTDGYYGLWNTEIDAIVAWNHRADPEPDKVWEDIKAGKGISRETPDARKG